MPNQEPTAPVGARDVIAESLRDLYPDTLPGTKVLVDAGTYLAEADQLLASLRANGLVIVAAEDVVIPAWFAAANGITQAAITEVADRLRAALGGE